MLRPEADMDPTRDAQLAKRIWQGLLGLLCVGVWLAAFLAVIQGWHSFNAKAKFVAIPFLLILVLYPRIESVARKSAQRDVVSYGALIFGYVLVLLALIVFT